MTAGPIMISGFIQGLGVGLLFAPLNIAGLRHPQPGHRTEGTIVSTMVRSLGSSMGISIIQAMLTAAPRSPTPGSAEQLVAGNPAVTAACRRA